MAQVYKHSTSCALIKYSGSCGISKDPLCCDCDGGQVGTGCYAFEDFGANDGSDGLTGTFIDGRTLDGTSRISCLGPGYDNNFSPLRTWDSTSSDFEFAGDGTVFALSNGARSVIDANRNTGYVEVGGPDHPTTVGEYISLIIPGYECRWEVTDYVATQTKMKLRVIDTSDDSTYFLSNQWSAGFSTGSYVFNAYIGDTNTQIYHNDAGVLRHYCDLPTGAAGDKWGIKATTGWNISFFEYWCLDDDDVTGCFGDDLCL